jgi:TonB family protein
MSRYQAVYNSLRNLGGCLSSRAWSNVLLGAVISCLHVLVCIYVMGFFGDVRRADVIRDVPSASVAYVVNQPIDMDVVPMPEVNLTTIRYDTTELAQVRFDDAEQGDTEGVVAVASAPRLTQTCTQVCDPARFAANVGLVIGQTVTVVLVIEVLADGSTGLTDVLKSSGNSAADAAAIEYAQSLHWVPGTRNHQALSMRIRFPVTFASARS